MSTSALPLNYPIELITLEDLANILQKTPAALYSLLSRNKDALPPRVMLPGIRRIYFRKIDIETWITTHIEHTESSLHTTTTVPEKKNRGRPTKFEQIRRSHKKEIRMVQEGVSS